MAGPNLARGKTRLLSATRVVVKRKAELTPVLLDF